MVEPRLVPLGKVSVRRGDIVVEPEPHVEVVARPGEELLLALFYDYREGSHEKERVHLQITARLGAGLDVTSDAHLTDRPVLVDDRQGYFSVPVRAPSSGTVEGTAEVRGAYSIENWVGGGDRTQIPVRATIPLRVRVG